MDPNANLEEQRDIADGILSAGWNADHTDDAERLAELVLALDSWIKSGGFLPRPWKEAQQ
jgi:hypothetical protein